MADHTFEIKDNVVLGGPQNAARGDTLSINGPPFYDLYAARSGGGRWIAKGKPLDWTLHTQIFDASNRMWCVGTGWNVCRQRDGDPTQWDRQGPGPDDGFMGGWQILSLAFDAYDKLWCVGRDYNVGAWSGSDWNNQPSLNSWQLKMLAFDRTNAKWCVRETGSIGAWNETYAYWEEQNNPPGVRIEAIAFDLHNRLWAVDDHGSVHVQKSKRASWIKLDKLHQEFKCLAFDVHNNLWCIGRRDGALGVWADDTVALVGTPVMRTGVSYKISMSAPDGCYCLKLDRLPVVSDASAMGDATNREVLGNAGFTEGVGETANGKLNVGSGPGK